jgi:hypothetical protein
LKSQKKYTVATTDYVAYKAYKEWFEGKQPQLLDADIKDAVETELRLWHKMEEDIPFKAFIRDTPRWSSSVPGAKSNAKEKRATNKR